MVSDHGPDSSSWAESIESAYVAVSAQVLFSGRMAQLGSSMRNSIVDWVKLWSRVPPGRRAREKQAEKQLTTN